MAAPEITRSSRSAATPRLSTLVTAACLALLMVAAGTVIFLAQGLPKESAETLRYPATGLKFVFGSGSAADDMLQVKEFANGYALLSGGPVSIQASDYRVLRYTWLPPQMPLEAAFFWRRADDPQNVLRTEITARGTHLIDLFTEPDWQGEITEIGFLVAGENGKPVEVGETMLLPDSLETRLQLTWRAWATFEEWSQQSINFLYGGDYRQVTPLPLLIAAWLLFSVVFLWLFLRFGRGFNVQQFLVASGLLFLIAWVLLDLRWTVNNIRQTQLSLINHWQADQQQVAVNELDGEIVQYVQRLKSTVLGERNNRILIIGDDNSIDYYLLRAKYHLLPHSANVAGRFTPELKPDSLDFVIFFGQPTGIINIPGYNRNWKNSLVRVDSSEFGVVFRVK